MKGSNSLEVVRNMKNTSLFTAICSLVLLFALIINPGLLATIGYVAYLCFTVISTYLFIYSMKQYGLWTANEVCFLKEARSSLGKVIRDE